MPLVRFPFIPPVSFSRLQYVANLLWVKSPPYVDAGLCVTYYTTNNVGAWNSGQDLI